MVLVVLSACGPGSGVESGPALSAPTTTVPGEESTSTVSERDEVERLVAAVFDPEYTEAQRREVEDSIRDCMALEGFSYEPPYVMADEIAALVANPWVEMDELRVDRRRFAEEYGYGVFGFLDATTLYVAVLDATASTREDPLGLMSASEREAYREALYGPPAEPPENWEGGYYSEEGGCRREALEEVFGAAVVSEEEESELLNEVEAWVRADPEWLETERSWEACMAEAGYEVASPFTRFDVGEAYRDYPEQLVLARRDEVLSGAVWEWREVALADGSTLEVSLPVYDDAEFEAGLAFELALAWADFECVEQVDLVEVRRRVTGEAQQRVIREHFGL